MCSVFKTQLRHQPCQLLIIHCVFNMVIPLVHNTVNELALLVKAMFLNTQMKSPKQ